MSIEMLIGQTLVDVSGLEEGSERALFTTQSGRKFIMFHHQDCCESVEVNDVIGDVQDIIGSPIVMAEEATNKDDPPDTHDTSFTWTFYKIGTNKGSITIRWYGESNGYYSEDVDFEEEKAEEGSK